MPYQGPNGYIPPGQYGNQDGRGFQTGHAQMYQGNRPNQAPQHLPQYPTFEQAMYNASHSQTQHSTPQFYGQGHPPASFYQTPTAQYQQQPYLSPPSQTAQIPQIRYSPDPLQHYQPPPRAHVGTSSQGRPQQQQPPQRTPSQPQRPISQGQSVPHVQQQFSQPNVPYAGSAQRNANATPQRQTPQSQRPPQIQQRAQVDTSRPSPAQVSQSPNSQSSNHQIQHSQPQPRSHQATPPGTINPNAMHRQVAHVQLPTQRSLKTLEEGSMARPPKRRKSNEGHPVPTCGPSTGPQAISRHVKQEPPASSPLTELTSSQMPPTPTPANVNYQAVLLGLCDEYISAAYSMSVGLSGAEVSDQDLDTYHSLLATGMACLNSVLSNYHISDPRLEGRVRLRLASLLFEETENDMDAEEVLTKGISLCERARLRDLKYAMHHLLARIWFKGGKIKAAMKAVDKLIVEVEKQKLVHWAYTFRFLRVTLGVQTGVTIAETAALVKNLSAIIETAEHNGHVSVHVMANLLQALIYLRSRTPESVDLAQRSVASARMHQLSPELMKLPRFQCLLDFVDLACSLIRFDNDQVNAKSENMQRNLDSSARNSSWDKHADWQISFGQLPSSSTNIEVDTGGMLKTLDTGECAFAFRWLTKSQIHTLSYLFAGLSSMNKNASHEQKAEAYLTEGVKLGKLPLGNSAQSLPSASAQCNTNSLLLMSLRLHAVFARCGRCDWDTALRGIASIRRDIEALETPPNQHTFSLISYLEALCKHGLGDLQGALKLYHSNELKTGSNLDAKAAAGSVDTIRILAALSSILIMRHNGDRQAADQLLSEVQNACLTNPNSNGNEYGSKPVESAFFILKATEDPYKSAENIIIKTKQYLQSAVQSAKAAVNNQLLCIVMNIMTDLFFTNIVGDQAEKSAKAARSLATKSQDKLWTAVADDMCANTLERTGRIADAQSVRQEGQEALQRLPESLKTALLRDEMMVE
ncbi:hypothetical protein M409DRAFT_67387 [Zasmidium cellare ATCC 36951]|uniref:Uncharacterized protein n=1 Tax=Zasmidium cellare ATCC 36951 TaxID=1080233 RepID=A0A6A6CI57_ZASCE|nr:uncharacterized protein M409DRAFT_67387 [Zasmidium cellare ATCC 36951]KAF2165096.1 hypothetical protein M409DRAFT_67387 [Zasmidium cellare ATCC 36951]